MNLNIRGKILVGYAVILLLMLGTCLYFVSEMKKTDSKYNEMINNEAFAYSSIQGTIARYNEAGIRLKDYIINGRTSDISLYQKAMNEGDTTIEKIIPIIDTGEEKQLYNDMQSNVNTFKEFGNQVISLVKAREESQTETSKTVANKKVMEFLQSDSGVISNLTQSGETLANFQSKLLNDDKKQTSASANRTIFVSLIVVFVIIIIGLIIGFFVAQMIASPIRLVDTQAAKIANGDLTGDKITIKTRDEAGRLAESFNTMHQNLIEIVKQLQEKSENVASSAAELSASAENVSAGATETASTMTEVATTVEQILVILSLSQVLPLKVQI